MKESLPGFTLRRTRLRRNLVSVHGFTLIELLIVITIIGILSAVGLTTFPGAFARARDTQRLDDAKKITSALQSFYGEKNRYPANSSCGASWCTSTSGGTTWIGELSPTYLPAVPSDPVNSSSPDLLYKYTTDTLGNDYCVEISQERDATRHRNYKTGTENPWKLRFGPLGVNGGLCASR